MRCFKLMKALLNKLRIGVRVLCFNLRSLSDDDIFVGVQPLPDDILVEILSRLPAEKVLEFRLVCKHWNTLTCTPHFTRKHFKTNSANPSIIIMYSKPFGFGTEEHVFLFDEWGGATRKPKKLSIESIYPRVISKTNAEMVMFYNDGMLNAVPKNFHPTGRDTFILYNPVMRQNLVMDTDLGYLFACFYHSVANEYRLLYYRCTSDASVVEYQICCLGSSADKLSWRRLANFDFAPIRYSNAVRTCYSNNDFLHWFSVKRNDKTYCSYFYLMFDVIKEEFSSMPHPGDLDLCSADCDRHKRMFSIGLNSGVESLLCLCDCSTQDQIDMWVLEDHEKRIWVKWHRIVLDVAVYRSQPNSRGDIAVKPLGVLNGEMLINMNRLGVFTYNIRTGTLRRIIEIVDGIIGFDSKGNDYVRDVRLFQQSLVPFHNYENQHFIMEPF